MIISINITNIHVFSLTLWNFNSEKFEEKFPPELKAKIILLKIHVKSKQLFPYIKLSALQTSKFSMTSFFMPSLHVYAQLFFL